MILALLQLAAAAQDAPAVRLPPRTTNSIATRIVPAPAPGEMGPAVPIEIRVSSPEGLLWHDTLRVARNSGASYSYNKSEAGPGDCAAGSYDRSRRTALNINLYLREDSQQGQLVNVSVSWTRPNAGGTCALTGTRGVQIDQAFPLVPGQPATVTGDGGLTVTVTRR